MTFTAATLIEDAPAGWFLEAAACPCDRSALPGALHVDGLRDVRPGRTLGAIAARMVCIRCRAPARQVVLTDQCSPRYPGDVQPPQTVRVVVFERR